MSELIDNLRRAMGTLPSQSPEKVTALWRGVEHLEVKMIDWPKNPYKAVVSAATATWGDDHYRTKWQLLTPENRFRVVLAAITGNTLPQACETPQFTWKVYGGPRNMFDQHARARIGSTFFSIGSRDNNKLDSSIIIYTKLYDKHYKVVKRHMQEMKNLYEYILKSGEGSWQTARAVLPMSYHHPYHFTQNYLALQGQCARRMQFCEEEFIVGLHWLLRESVKQKFPLLAEYLRPGCDRAHKCTYAKSYGLSNAFGCLFAGCGRWDAQTEYSTFNESCSDVEEIEKQLKIHIKRPEEWVDYTENDYEKLHITDKLMFEED